MMDEARLIGILSRAEDRLTRTARDERDLDVLLEIRHALADLAPQGVGRRFAQHQERTHA
jgi:hypothetical protein